MLVAGGSTDVTTYFKLRLAADGTAATGLTITDFDLQYVRSGVAPVAKVDATALGATDSAHADNKAFEIDATDQPGLYRVDWPDAAFVAGVREVILTVKVATAFTEELRVTIDGEVNVVQWLGTAVSANTAGIPNVDMVRITNSTNPANTLSSWLQTSVNGIADSGTTTTMVDAALSQADGVWNGAMLLFKTGANNGYSALVTDFDAASDTITFAPAVPNAVTTENYTLIKGLGWADVQAVGGTVQTAGDLAALITTVDTVVDEIKAATIAAAGVVETSGSNSSTQVQTDLAEATNDHYDVMTILFIAGAEAGQSRLITGYVGATGVVSWNAALTGTPADGVSFVILSAGTTADAVWDEILTGSSHNIPTSAGKRLRQIEEAFVHASGVIDTVTNGHTFVLDAGALDVADYYVGDRLQITEGTGAGQSRIITRYASGRIATLDSDFTTNPDTASLYDIVAADAHVSVSDSDLATGFVAVYTNATTITLDVGAEANADFYVGELIIFTHGTGMGQAREITAYTAGRVVTMSPSLEVALDTTTTYHIQAAVSVPEIVDEILDEALSGHTTAGTLGKAITDIETIATALDTLTKAAGAGDLAAVLTAVAAIQAATDNLPADPADQSLIIAATDANLAAIGALNNIAGSDVLTQINAALDTAISELGVGVPTATPTLRTAAMLLYMALRNKLDVQTSGVDALEIHNDAGTLIAKKLLTDDGSDYSEAKATSG